MVKKKNLWVPVGFATFQVETVWSQHPGLTDCISLPLPPPSSSSLPTHHLDWRASANEPESGSQAATPACRCCSAVSPAVRRVDENKDLHILMNKTPWHPGRGLSERERKERRRRKRRRRRWGRGRSENGEKEGLGSFGINLVGIPQGYANIFWVAVFPLCLFISVALSLWPLHLVRAVASSAAPNGKAATES